MEFGEVLTRYQSSVPSAIYQEDRSEPGKVQPRRLREERRSHSWYTCIMNALLFPLYGIMYVLMATIRVLLAMSRRLRRLIHWIEPELDAGIGDEV